MPAAATIVNAGSVFQKGDDRRRFEFLAAVKKLELDEELRFEQVAADFADECGGGGRCAARREEIVDQHDFFTALDRVYVKLHLGFPIFERILGTLGLVRKPTLFAQRDESDAKIVGHRRAEEKSARIDPDDLVDLLAATLFKERFNSHPEKSSTAQDRSDVLENDSFFWEIRHVPDRGPQFFERIGKHGGGTLTACSERSTARGWRPVGFDATFRFMKRSIALLGFVAVLALGKIQAAAPATTPEECIRNFYGWYVANLVANRDPMKQRAEIRRYATERLLREIAKMEKGPDGLDGDYFVDAQDFDPLWARNIVISGVKTLGDKSSAHVLLNGSKGMRKKLTVHLVKQAGIWKVDKVEGAPGTE